MGCTSFDDLVAHLGHKIEVIVYGEGFGDCTVAMIEGDEALGDKIVNVAVECLDCCEVLFDFDK